jgi:chorismate--pyruvate lyase
VHSPRICLHWIEARSLSTHRVCPNKLTGWLKDPGSLTAHLLKLSRGKFKVEILFQGLAPIRLDEQRLLGLKRPTAVLVREVVLYGKDQPWVFARSLLPLPSLTGRLRQLRKAGRKPLGSFLFKQPKLHRGPLHVAQFKPETCVVPGHLQQGQTLWGRCSLFYLDQKPLLVSETFLPDFLQHIGQSKTLK